ncbi:MAG: 2-dehydropantoate 2-reductase [Firmicutes bacterium]|nr:2-dehydropantoate 2-reductase [Alicyclobacillaceae bacterium]MCL6496017.1 2-dehydropantoate 2-reductase [Bacillota bacterium]
MPTVVVLGAGAIGGLYAAHLGHVATVWAVDPWAAHVAAINAGGLKLEGRGATTVTEVRAVTEAAALRGMSVDLVVVAVKSTDTRAAVGALAPELAGRPVWLSVQNGLGNEEVIAEIAGGPVLQGMTMNAATVLAPGRIRHEVAGPTWFGPHTGVGVDEVQWVAELLRAGGMEPRLEADPRGAIWTKLLFNVGLNAVTALTRLPSARLVEIEEMRELIAGVIREGMAVAERLGIRLEEDPVELATRPRRSGGPAHFASMAQDIFRGRPTEIDALNGAIVRLAEAHGLSAPLNRAITALIRGLERSPWREMAIPEDA